MDCDLCSGGGRRRASDSDVHGNLIGRRPRAGLSALRKAPLVRLTKAKLIERSGHIVLLRC